ncbi:unnamed protein product [Acanthoscelides obtectus]|uniref:Large ribosomal subunit protein uL30m n=1 Tax=Acanthoscelides obtectus TaxID=200917 RepID=A0A9P0KJK6_ACAOB|nr:unnamed protein product [Acanthoscelides obtectus]CAK1669332.1 39S ribosomal protein L30, mitochondrial [Acanthoscelides obtectus]
MNLLKNIFTPALSIQRNVGKCKYNWYGEGIQYLGFKYYPRNADFKDPPYEPTKLFRVERIKPMKGLPYWERHILKELKLDGKNHSYTVVKNIPEINHRLWKVKHVIKIAPITFPDGLPTKDDVTYLKENGELQIIKKIGPLEERMKLADAFRSDVKRLDGDTLRRDSRKKWLSGWDC